MATTNFTELSLAALTEQFEEHLPKVVQDESTLVKAGAQYVGKADNFTKVTLGAPSAVDEGEEKPSNAFDLEDTEVKKTTIATIVTVTKQSLKRDSGKVILQDLLRQAASGLSRGAETVVYHGTDPKSGIAIAKFADVNLADNSKQHFYTEGTDKVDRVLNEGALDVENADSLMLSNAGYKLLASMYTESGVKLYREATKKAQFEIENMIARVARQVGEPGWDGSTSDVLAIGGDFTGLRMGLDNIDVDVSKDAIVNGVNMFTTNRIAYRIEAELAFANTAPNELFVVKTAE